MQKSSLNQNILPKAKQRLIINDLPDADKIVLLTRDPINMEIGVINLPDQTRVPGGRRRAGEFAVEFQFARNEDRQAYLGWFALCIDTPADGIKSNYKKSGVLHYLRLFKDSANKEVLVQLRGLWCSKFELPGGDIKEDNGDSGDSVVKATLQYDDCFF